MTLENPHGIYIDMDQFTTDVNTVTKEEHGIKSVIVTGTGIFDILMNTATKHVEAQFESNRIRGEEYATAYLQMFQACMGAAVQIWLQKPIAELQKESEEAKRELYYRQIEGFDEDYKQKILKICMDSWAVGFSVARDSFQATGIPAPMQKDTIDDLYNKFINPEFDQYPYKRHPDTLNRDKLTSSRAITEVQWFYLQSDNKMKRPVSESRIKSLLLSGIIDRDTMVWRDGFTTWLNIMDTSLATYIDSNIPPTPTVIEDTPDEEP